MYVTRYQLTTIKPAIEQTTTNSIHNSKNIHTCSIIALLLFHVLTKCSYYLLTLCCVCGFRDKTLDANDGFWAVPAPEKAILLLSGRRQSDDIRGHQVLFSPLNKAVAHIDLLLSMLSSLRQRCTEEA